MGLSGRRGASTDPLTGEFLLTTVPERTDASPFEYTVTYSLPGFVAMDSETKVSVGFGSGLEYQVDAVCCSDPDPMSPMLMLPVGVVPDMVCPECCRLESPGRARGRRSGKLQRASHLQ